MLRNLFHRSTAMAFAAIFAFAAAGVSEAASYATDWVEGHNSRTRVLVGGAPAADGSIKKYVAFEIWLAPGWKTYWRQPGSAGGIPPQLEWAGSENLKRATLHYPAPIRMVDPTGATIGYKQAVVFPVEVEPENAALPVLLNLSAFFGVCREICIPADARFKVTIPPGLFNQTPPELAKALAEVPVNSTDKDNADVGLPVLVSASQGASEGASEGITQGKSAENGHTLTFDVRFAAGIGGADLFAETGDGQSLAMSNVVAILSPDTIRYEIAVTDPEIWQSLLKNGMILTMVSENGSREVRRPLP